MAKMFPKVLPAHVLNNPKLRGEREVYEALARLPDDFEVFYNRTVTNEKGVKAFERKIDFIILHHHLGLLAIEVKGGKIRIGEEGLLEQFIPPKNFWKSIAPLEQVQRAMRDLIFTAKKDGVKYFIPDNCCVIFPNVQRHQVTSMPHLLPHGTLCLDDLPILKQQLPPLFSGSLKKPAWKPDQAIDMRRRLQALPEGKGGRAGQAGETTQRNEARKTEVFSSKPAAKRHKPADDGVGDFTGYDWNEDLDNDQVSPIRNEPRYYTREEPYAYLKKKRPPSKNAAYKKKLRKREIVWAFIVGLLAFAAVSWLFPNSFVRHFLKMM